MKRHSLQSLEKTKERKKSAAGVHMACPATLFGGSASPSCFAASAPVSWGLGRTIGPLCRDGLELVLPDIAVSERTSWPMDCADDDE